MNFSIIDVCNSKIIHIFEALTKIYNTMKKTFYLTVIVLAFLLCSSQTIVCPPTQYSIYPDMNDCASYYECNNGLPIHHTCPEGFLFDIALQACVAASLVDCNGRPVSGESGNYYYWKELEDQDCKCLQPDGTYVSKTGTTCVTNGTGKECNYCGLCSVPGYGTCYKS